MTTQREPNGSKRPRLLFLYVALFSLGLSNVSQPAFAKPHSYCEVHFQARANWMRAMGYNEVAADRMEEFATLMWYAVPRDYGMRTGFGSIGTRYVPDQKAALFMMTKWAERGGPRPQLETCMENKNCTACMRELSDVIGQ